MRLRFFVRLAKDTHEIAQHSKSETDVVRKPREGQQREGRDHIEQKTLHLEICFGRASATYQEHKQVFRLDVDGVFVWSFAHVHESSRHRAVRSRMACGYFLFYAVLVSLFLWQRVLAATSSCSCLWHSFFCLQFDVSIRCHIFFPWVSLQMLKEITRHVCESVSVRVNVCFCGCLCSRVRTFDVLWFRN